MTETELHTMVNESHEAFVTATATDLAERWAKQCRLQTERYRELERDVDEWQRCAEALFRAAVGAEQERDESDALLQVLRGCLQLAEEDIEWQAAEIVALRNERDEFLAAPTPPQGSQAANRVMEARLELAERRELRALRERDEERRDRLECEADLEALCHIAEERCPELRYLSDWTERTEGLGRRTAR